MTIKILPNEKGNPPGKLADAEAALHSGSARRTEADRVRGMGAQVRNRPERHIPGAAVLRQRRAAELRPAAPDWRRDIARPHSRSDPAGVPGARGGGGRRILSADRCF